MRRLRWVSTVFVLTLSAAAISRVALPSARSCSTSRSRSLRTDRGGIVGLPCQVAVIIQHDTGDGGAQVGLPRGDRSNGERQFIESGVLEQTPRGARAQHSGDKPLIGMSGESDHSCVGVVALNLGRGIDAVQVGHPDVQNCDIR